MFLLVRHSFHPRVWRIQTGIACRLLELKPVALTLFVFVFMVPTQLIKKT